MILCRLAGCLRALGACSCFLDPALTGALRSGFPRSLDGVRDVFHASSYVPLRASREIRLKLLISLFNPLDALVPPSGG